jgi:hypothetical protein
MRKSTKPAIRVGSDSSSNNMPAIFTAYISITCAVIQNKQQKTLMMKIISPLSFFIMLIVIQFIIVKIRNKTGLLPSAVVVLTGSGF